MLDMEKRGDKGGTRECAFICTMETDTRIRTGIVIESIELSLSYLLSISTLHSAAAKQKYSRTFLRSIGILLVAFSMRIGKT